jgi:predicted regulator of Ras-like GTPase activity (Roadblock/LC7/MglB family)
MTPKVQETLGDVNLVTGVIGSFVCSEEGDYLGSAPGRLFDRRALQLVGRTAAQILSGLRSSHRGNIEVVDLAYTKWRLLIQPFRGGCLCVLCLPTANLPMVKMAAASAAKRLAAAATG